jgi:Xaa-Pro dipeptidase
VESIHFRFLETQFLQTAAPHAKITAADTILSELRMHKDLEEIAAMKKAVKIAQDALLATLNQVRLGITERQIAAELVSQLLRHGSDPELPFQPIVSTGPNSANPACHAHRPACKLVSCCIIDWAPRRWVHLDLTRVMDLGPLPDELQTIHGLLHRANAQPGSARHGVPAVRWNRPARR